MSSKPLLKWAGGKSFAVKLFGKTIANYLDKTKGVYYEPFVGGGAMAFHLARPDMVLFDINESLMNFYRVLRDEPRKLSYALAELRSYGITKEAYLKIREVEADTPIMAAARFLYLNRVGFNGLYRENSKGKYNVPYGDGNPKFPSREEIDEASQAIKRSELPPFADFSHVVDCAGADSLVFCDPPYHSIGDKAFTDYNKDGFSERDQERLAVCLYHASERGSAVIAHNHDTPLIRYLYGEWCTITPIAERRQGNSDPTKRSEKAPCVIITKGITLPIPVATGENYVSGIRAAASEVREI